MTGPDALPMAVAVHVPLAHGWAASQKWTHLPPAFVVSRHISPSPHAGGPAAGVHDEPYCPAPLAMQAKVAPSFVQHVWPAAHSNGASLHGVGELELLLEHARSAAHAPAARTTAKRHARRRSFTGLG